MSDSRVAVYLLHGIRDFAGWTTDFKSVFQQNGLKSGSQHLGWIGVEQFILPESVYMENEEKIISDIKSYNGDDLTIIAHSFGGWIISKILERNKRLKIRRLIICNTVVHRSFDWHKLSNVQEIICVCGNRDIWPCVAEIVSSRFSSTGTSGCQHPRVDDVYFDGGHGHCLTRQFCQTHFLPLVKNNTPITGDERQESKAVKSVRYLNANRIAIIFFIVLVLSLLRFMPLWLSCAVSSCYVDIVRTDDFSNSLQDAGFHSYVRDVLQSYSFNYDEPTISLNLKKTHDCEIIDGAEKLNPDNLVSIKVFDMLSNPSEPLRQQDKFDCYYRFEVPVRRRQALLRIQQLDADQRPGGGGLAIPYVVRNLTYVVTPAPDTTVELRTQVLDQEHARAYSRLQAALAVIDDAAVAACRPIGSGQAGTFTLSCPGIWLMPKGYRYFPTVDLTRIYHPGDMFLFCFSLANWKTGANKKSGEKCILPTAPQKI